MCDEETLCTRWPPPPPALRYIKSMTYLLYCNFFTSRFPSLDETDQFRGFSFRLLLSQIFWIYHSITALPQNFLLLLSLSVVLISYAIYKLYYMISIYICHKLWSNIKINLSCMFFVYLSLKYNLIKKIACL